MELIVCSREAYVHMEPATPGLELHRPTKLEPASFGLLPGKPHIHALVAAGLIAVGGKNISYRRVDGGRGGVAHVR
jgi:hypothetical protein